VLHATQQPFSALKGATEQHFAPIDMQHSAGVQQIKTAAVESFGIPQASRAAATLGSFPVWGR